MRRTAYRIIAIVSTILVSSMALAACSSNTTTNSATSPSAPTAASVQAYANPITENVLVSLRNNDYTSFSKDFDQTAKSAIGEATFAQTYTQISATIGSYQSLLYFNYSTQNANATTVLYVARYSNEPAGAAAALLAASR